MSRRPALLALLAASAVAIAPAAQASVLALAAPAVPAVAARPAKSDLPLTSIKVGGKLVARGFVQPTAVVSLPDGRVLVAERRGTVRVVANGRLQRGFYLDLRARVAAGGNERGLLGLVVDPTFGSTGRLWAAYTAKGTGSAAGALVLARAVAATAGAGAVPLRQVRTVMSIPHPGASNHNGGSLVFGPDGLLYWGTGDGGGGGDGFDNARQGSSLLGKVLRLDVRRTCGTKRYCVPPSNPRFSQGRTTWRPEIWAIGLRNPWRMSVDPATGALWIGDVGQDRFEEVDRVATGTGGFDFGWPCREGRSSYDASRCGGRTMTAPLLVRCHPGGVSGCSASQGGESITGGVVYRGSAQILLRGVYVFSDFITGNLWLYRGGVIARAGTLRYVSSFGRSARGEVLAVTYGGSLVRLVAAVR